MGRATDQIHQSRHTEKPAPDAEEPCKHTGQETHTGREPCRTGEPRGFEMHHGRDIDFVKCFVPGYPFRPALTLDSPRLFFTHGFRIIIENHERDESKKKDIDITNYCINTAEAFEVH